LNLAIENLKKHLILVSSLEKFIPHFGYHLSSQQEKGWDSQLAESS
jgi:hypothetical protein